MKKLYIFILAFIALPLAAQDLTSTDKMLLEKIRSTSITIPGDLPTEINYIKFAENPRKWSDTIEDGGSDEYIQARTAFQIMFKDSFIMIDSGMDEETSRFFGSGTFFQDKKDRIDIGLEQSKLVVITHEHADHVAGVIRNPNREKIANKTILTQAMVNTLINTPQTPLIQITQKQSQDYIVIDFPEIVPVAPGIVLIKTPGHTKGGIMVYAKMQNGNEYIFTGDVTWSYKGIVEKKQKPESQIERIGEDSALIDQEINWLNMLLDEPGLYLIVSHDDILLKEMTSKKLIKDDFRL